MRDNSVFDGISRDIPLQILRITRDIPVLASLKEVTQVMLSYARSRSLPNAPITCTIIGSGHASFIFHQHWRLVSLPGRAAAPLAGLASPWATSESGGVGASSAGRAWFPPAAWLAAAEGLVAL